MLQEITVQVQPVIEYHTDSREAQAQCCRKHSAHCVRWCPARNDRVKKGEFLASYVTECTGWVKENSWSVFAKTNAHKYKIV